MGRSVCPRRAHSFSCSNRRRDASRRSRVTSAISPMTMAALTYPIPKSSVSLVPVARTASRISVLIAAKPFVDRDKVDRLVPGQLRDQQTRGGHRSDRSAPPPGPGSCGAARLRHVRVERCQLFVVWAVDGDRCESSDAVGHGHDPLARAHPASNARSPAQTEDHHKPRGWAAGASTTGRWVAATTMRSAAPAVKDGSTERRALERTA